jgi:hypothetical protein
MQPCKRYGPAITDFVTSNANKYLGFDNRKEGRAELLNIMADTSIDATTRQLCWIRQAKGFERYMDQVIVDVSVIHFKCHNGHMPTLDDIFYGSDSFEDSYNFEGAICSYKKPTWPAEFDNKDSVKKAAMQELMTYMSGVHERALADHRASRCGAYA